MKLFLHPNGTTLARQATSHAVIRALSARFDCFVSRDTAVWLGGVGCQIGEAKDCDAVCAIGGDGTALHAAPIALAAEIPLFGVNMGRRGYLCSFDQDELGLIDEAAVSCLVPSSRTLLGFTWQEEQRFALNDLVIAKGDFGTTVDIAARIGTCDLGVWQCDGAVIATPTGSSGYNLSGGGPRLLPDARCFVITPICPVAHSASPTVFADTQHIALSAHTRDQQPKARLYADGTLLGELNHELILSAYPKRLTLLMRRL